jgi:hypothetical protein
MPPRWPAAAGRPGRRRPGSHACCPARLPARARFRSMCGQGTQGAYVGRRLRREHGVQACQPGTACRGRRTCPWRPPPCSSPGLPG